MKYRALTAISQLKRRAAFVAYSLGEVLERIA
jgi:hypothetical protein